MTLRRTAEIKPHLGFNMNGFLLAYKKFSLYSYTAKVLIIRVNFTNSPILFREICYSGQNNMLKNVSHKNGKGMDSLAYFISNSGVIAAGY